MTDTSVYTTVSTNVVTVTETPTSVLIQSPDINNTVEVLSGGPQGPRGEPGEPGPTQRHVHTQLAPASTWTINHTLEGKPSITVVDSSDTVVIGDVTYIDDTQIVVSFSGAFSGYAYLT